MATAVIQLVTDAGNTGKLIDCESMTVNSNTVFRQNICIADPVLGANVATVAQFHNADNVALGGSAYGITAGGISQVLNVNGNLDRCRGAQGDGVPGSGIPLDCSMFAQYLYQNMQASSANLTAGANKVITIANTTNYAVGQIVLVDVFGANPEWARINTVTANTSIQVDNLNFAHNGSVTAFVVQPVYFNTPRDAAGEGDLASGVGTNIAADYNWDGLTYERQRNTLGLNIYTDTLNGATVASNLTVITTTATPPALPAGTMVILDAGNAAVTELCQVVAVNTGAKTITVVKTLNAHGSGVQIAAPFQGLTQAPQNFTGSGIAAEAAVLFSGLGAVTKIAQYSVEKDVNAAGLTPTQGAASGTGIDADCVYGCYQSAPATLTNLQMAPLLLDPAGNTMVGPRATTTAGMNKAKLRSLAATVTAIKTTPGTLYGVLIVNNTAAAAFVQIFDAATGSVTLGTTTPDVEFQVAANSSLPFFFPPCGVSFGVAISAASTTLEGGSVGSAANMQLMAYYV